MLLFEILNKLKMVYKKPVKFFYTCLVRVQCKSCGDHLRVNYYSSVNKNTTLGNNINFNGFKVAGSGWLIIGNNFHSGKDVLVITQNHNYEGDAIPYDNTYVKKPVKIEDNVWVGARVIILPGVTVGEGAIIQAGSVVASDIPKYAIAGGHPAKRFKQRDAEHYEKLKREGKFH